MDLQEKWICRKNRFAGKIDLQEKMELQEKWIYRQIGFAGKMDLKEKWI